MSSEAPSGMMRVDAAVDFFQNFGVALKNISLYRHNSSGYERFLAPSVQSLVRYHEMFGSLSVRIKPFEFHLDGYPVFEDDSQENNIPWKFYREGFRLVTFERGMDAHDLALLIDVLIQTPRELTGTDLNTLLWKYAVPHFSYLILEGFQQSEEDDGETVEGADEELDMMVDFLRNQLHSDSKYAVNFRGLSEEDLSLHENLSSAEAQRGIRLEAPPVPEEEIQAIQMLVQEEDDILPLKSTELVLMLLTQAYTSEEIEQLEEIIMPIAENLLLIQDFNALGFLVADLLTIGEALHPSAQGAFHSLQQRLLDQFGTPERLNPVLELLDSRKMTSKEFQAEIRSYLSLLGDNIQDTLLSRVSDVSAGGRRMLLEVLLEQPSASPMMPRLISLYGNNPSILLDLITIGKKTGEVFGKKELKQFIANSSPLVRMEGLLAFAAQFQDEALDVARGFLYDFHSATHRAAIEVLCKVGPQGVLIIMEYVRSDEFLTLGEKEQKMVFRLLGQTKNRSVLNWFEETLNQKSGLFRAKVDQMKELVLGGLAAYEHQDACRLIQKSLQQGKHSKPIKEELEKTLAALRFRLDGTTGR